MGDSREVALVVCLRYPLLTACGLGLTGRGPEGALGARIEKFGLFIAPIAPSHSSIVIMRVRICP